MVSPFVGNRGQNSSFLVLNVGDNTLGLCNPFMIPKSSEAKQDGSIEDNLHDNAIVDSDVISSSIDETSSESQEGMSRKPSKDSEDPNWLPKKKARWSSSSSCEAAKPKSGPSMKRNTSEVSPRDRRSLLPSISGSPPEYLVSLLSYFGWRVAFQPDSGDYIYTSPAGHSYFSLPKAFESFLQETSKYKGKPWFTSQFNDNMAVNTLSLQGFQTNLQNASNGSANNCTENNERDTRTMSIVDKPMKILKPVKKPRTPRVGLSCKRGNALLQKPLTLCQGLKQPISSPNEDEHAKSHAKGKASVNEFNQASREGDLSTRNGPPHSTDMQKYEEMIGLRRSARLSGRHVPIEGELDLEATDNTSCYLTNQNVSKDKGECTVNAQEESFLHGMPSSYMTKESNEARKLSSSVMSINHSISNVERNSTGRHFMHGDKDSERMTIQCSPSQIIMAENRYRENIYYAKNSKISDHTMEEGVNICTSKIDAVKRKCLKNVVGISRSMFVNQNVCLDDESGTDVGARDELSDMSNLGTRWMLRDESFQSSFGVTGSTGNTNLVLDNSHMLEYMEKDSEYEELISKQSVYYKSNKSEKTNGSETEITGNYLSYSATQEGKTVRKLKTRNKNTRDHHLVVRTNGNKVSSSQKKLTMLSWLLDSGVVNENDKVLYIPKNKLGNISCGMIIREGIWCDCCKKIMSLSEFGNHADGITLVPWENLYLMSGKTLRQCLKEAWDREREWVIVDVWAIGTDEPDPSDDTCGVCGDGGHLMCCDGCPSTFHQECLRLEDLPEGSWYCPYCRCKFCMMAKAVGGAKGSTLLECKQCGHKYHQNCAEKCDSHEDLKQALFCGKNCKELAAKLSNILGTRNPIEGGFSWTLLKCLDDEENSSGERDLFNLVCKLRLLMALSVLNECFNTLVDQRTGLDMVRQAVYSRRSNFHRLNYEGFYTLILEKDDEIISVASLRFIGTKFAEMPFIGTRPVYQRQGMCHRFLKAIEDVLSSLCIKELIIPAIPDLLETWMTSFSFRPLEPSLKNELRNCSMVNFPGTFLLQKSICNSNVVPQEGDLSTKGKHFHGKNILHNKELGVISCEHDDITLKDVNDQECWNQEYMVRPQDTSQDTWRTRGTSGCTSNFCKVLPDFSDRAVSGTSMPGQEMVRQSLVAPSSSPAIMNMVQYTQSHGTTTEVQHGIASPINQDVSMSNDQRSTCLQSGFEPEDFYSNIVASTLSFDNLLRMVN